ncbi:MAG: A/G-specific adenine glycosylase, partial [Evtepia sp.]|nr:A/G-specific adenine glycosylase [Evtepia sp.]
MENPLSFLPIPLLAWYRENARDLPWRREPTPYRVWVSEIMLQQTRVAAVLGYFARFMEAFPAVQDLAAAPEDQLMKLWQGLGYYSRARNLQKAARQIVEDFGGQFPTRYEELRSLAGVGDYTAAAIASIAFGQPVPAVDGNLLRVSARVLGDDTDITTAKGKKHFTAALQNVIPLDFPGQFNQAMMDLGATVCLPNGAPLCDRCPAAAFCRARREGRQRDLPVRPAKQPRRIEERVVFLLFYRGQVALRRRPAKKPRRVERRTVYFFFYEGKVALRRRPAKGLLAGLWEYPNSLEEEGNPLADWGFDGTETSFA